LKEDVSSGELTPQQADETGSKENPAGTTVTERSGTVGGVSSCWRGEGKAGLPWEPKIVLRRLALQGVVPVRRADEAVRDLLDLRITRYPHLVLLPRIWQLRHNLSANDAAYIVLAEKLGAALVTRDGRLASATGHAAAIELF